MDQSTNIPVNLNTVNELTCLSRFDPVTMAGKVIAVQELSGIIFQPALDSPAVGDKDLHIKCR